MIVIITLTFFSYCFSSSFHVPSPVISALWFKRSKANSVCVASLPSSSTNNLFFSPLHFGDQPFLLLAPCGPHHYPSLPIVFAAVVVMARWGHSDWCVCVTARGLNHATWWPRLLLEFLEKRCSFSGGVPRCQSHVNLKLMGQSATMRRGPTL